MTNIFFNSRAQRVGENKLEKAGNQCFVPIRLLWRGKTVKVKGQGQYSTKESFNPETRTGFKKFFSILALPLAVPLGTILKGLAYISKDTRNMHKILSKTLNSQNSSSPSLNSQPASAKTIPSLKVDESWGVDAAALPIHPTFPSELKVVSFNVGTTNDWTNLFVRDQLLQANEWEMNPDTIGEFPEKFDAFMATHAKEDLPKYQEQKVERHLGSLLDEFDPDILCLQEYYAGEAVAVKKFLEESGYEIIGIEDTAIAVKQDAFEKIQTGIPLHSDDSYFLNHELSVNTPRFLDILHIESDTVIRVASDHVKGFSVPGQKLQTENRRAMNPLSKFELSEVFEEREAQLLEKAKQGDFAAKGDLSLDISLHNLEGEGDVRPHIIIYGLDANASQKITETDEKVKGQGAHPKRMRLFDFWGYAGSESAAPTILDGTDALPRAYDYIRVKPLVENLSVEIESQVLEEINDPKLLHQPSKIMSDHLPALAVIKLNPATKNSKE